jgi:hypothetical protein
MKVSLETIHANQLLMIGMLQQLTKQVTLMAISLTAITAEVANNSSITQSVVTLLGNLTALIATIPPSTDPTTQAALDQLTATLTANDTTIAAAVVANTPAAVAGTSASSVKPVS